MNIQHVISQKLGIQIDLNQFFNKGVNRVLNLNLNKLWILNL